MRQGKASRKQAKATLDGVAVTSRHQGGRSSVTAKVVFKRHQRCPSTLLTILLSPQPTPARRPVALLLSTHLQQPAPPQHSPLSLQLQLHRAGEGQRCGIRIVSWNNLVACSVNVVRSSCDGLGCGRDHANSAQLIACVCFSPPDPTCLLPALTIGRARRISPCPNLSFYTTTTCCSRATLTTCHVQLYSQNLT